MVSGSSSASGGSAELPTITVVAGASSETVAETSLPTGSAVGRYVVLEELGSGGMGVVYAAYDPELHRKIALKLLRSGKSDESARLVREGQAMAQLAHPNVITIYEVGSVGENVFIAMELVEGKTARTWQREARRHWRDVVQVFVQAARGLAAAHCAGLVHRDVKPGNILIGDDGRVRVLDFGLAYAPVNASEGGHEGVEQTISSLGSDASSDTLSGPLTQTGKVMGTPAYMSPQQHAGRPTDPRSDQYSFCIALFEALYGQRPFVGDTANELKRRKWTGEISSPVAEVRVPGWLHRAVLRGLSLDPDKRWPSMEALIEQLERDPGRRRARLGGAALLGVGLIAGGVGLQSVGADTCSRSDEELVGVWDAERGAEVEAAIRGTGVVYAKTTWERVERGLEAYAASWVAAHRAACEATARHEQSSTMADRRVACLDRRRDELRATVGVLAQTDAASIKSAVSAVGNLRDVERCSDPAYLMASVAPPAAPDIARRVEEIRSALADADALDAAGRWEEGLVVARPLAEQAEATGYGPLIAEVAYRQGRLEERAGSFEDARRSLSKAYFTALGVGDDRTAVVAAAALVIVTSDKLARPEDAEQWAQHAYAELRRVGTDLELEAALSHAVAMSASARGDLETTLKHNVAAYEKLVQAFGPRDPAVARMMNNLGTTYSDLGRPEEALPYYERALEVWQDEFGGDHPNVATALVNIGVVKESLGDPEQARENYERALAIWEAGLGPDHPNVGSVLNNLAALVHDEGDLQGALDYHLRAAPIIREAYPADHPMVAMSLLNVGSVNEELGKLEVALSHYERARPIVEKALDPAHPFRAGALSHSARALRKLGRADESFARYGELLALGAEVPGELPDIEGEAHLRMGELRLEAGEPEQAIAHLEAAVAVYTEAGAEEHGFDLAVATFALARALRAEADDTEPAVSLARRARELFEASEDLESVAQVDAWLDEG